VAGVVALDTEDVLRRGKVWDPKGAMVMVTILWMVVVSVWPMGRLATVTAAGETVFMCGAPLGGAVTMAGSHCGNGCISLSPHQSLAIN